MRERERDRGTWGGLHAARKLTPTRAPGPRKRTSASSPTSEPTARADGVPSRGPPASCGAARAAVSAGSTISAPTSSAATSPRKRMRPSSTSTISWATAARLPGRTDNEIKNYWNTHIRRKLLSRGVDPITHRPIDERAPSTIAISSERKEEEQQQQQQQQQSSREESSSAQRQQAPKCPDLNLELCISPPLRREPSFQLQLGITDLATE